MIGACKACSAKDSEITFLRDLVAQQLRVIRKQEGLPEVPRDPQKPHEPMPETLRAIIQGMDSPGMRDHYFGLAEKEFVVCRDWNVVERNILDSLGVE